MFSNIKEKLGNVDMKSAGIGAIAVVAVEAIGFGAYKGGKYLYKNVKAALEARKLAKQIAAEEKEEQK